MTTNFGNVLTAMVTPFKADLSIDYEGTEKLVYHLIKNCTDTIVVAGTTGESPTLTHEEERQLCKFVKKTAKGEAKIVLGAGSNCTTTAIEATKEAEKLGVDGVLSVVPYYNKPSQQGLIEHYSQIAKSTSLPIIVYNIPSRTGINIEPETLAELASKYKNIVACKDSTGCTDNVSKIIRLAPKDFIIYSGDDYMTLPLLSIGAKGVVSVASHIIGNEIKEMINSFFSGKIDLARDIHTELYPLFKALFKAPNPTCVKAALEIKGLCRSELRPPLVKLNEKQVKELKQVMDNVNVKKLAAK